MDYYTMCEKHGGSYTPTCRECEIATLRARVAELERERDEARAVGTLSYQRADRCEAALRAVDGIGLYLGDKVQAMVDAALSGAAQPRGGGRMSIQNDGITERAREIEQARAEGFRRGVEAALMAVKGAGHVEGQDCGECPVEGCIPMIRSLAPDAQPRGEGARCEACGGDGYTSGFRKCPACHPAPPASVEEESGWQTCPVCDKPQNEDPGPCCAALHGLCGKCGRPRGRCKCMRTRVSAPPELADGGEHDGSTKHGRCGDHPTLGNVANRGVGCGEPFAWDGERYRCTDCDVVLHKRCAMKHFAASAATPAAQPRGDTVSCPKHGRKELREDGDTYFCPECEGKP
jgi:hypothetical protein